MPGKNQPRKRVDPEAALREYFSQELAEATTSMPRLPPLLEVPVDPEAPKAPVAPAILGTSETSRVPYQCYAAAKKEWPGYGFRNNLASLFLAACVLGSAALVFSCSPRAALASSIGQAMEGQGLEILKQDTLKAAGLVWQQGQEYFRQKHSGIVTNAGGTALEKENL
jgi:hypothetical protein